MYAMSNTPPIGPSVTFPALGLKYRTPCTSRAMTSTSTNTFPWETLVPLELLDLGIIVYRLVNVGSFHEIPKNFPIRVFFILSILSLILLE